MSRRSWIVVAAWLIPTVALAQAPSGGTPYRAWESSGGLQLAFWPNEDAVVRTPAWNVDVGRFWTPHFETSATLTANGEERYDFVSYRTFAGGSEYTSKRSRPAGLLLAGTYQFYENVFAHPYVSIGAQIGWFETVRDTESRTNPFGVLTETIGRSVEARPFVAAGFKSYFDNGRAFMRSELGTFVDPKGSPRAVIRIGAGVEF
jgi:hypothetical protein